MLIARPMLCVSGAPRRCCWLLLGDQRAEVDGGMGAYLDRMSGMGTATSSCIFCMTVYSGGRGGGERTRNVGGYVTHRATLGTSLSSSPSLSAASLSSASSSRCRRRRCCCCWGCPFVCSVAAPVRPRWTSGVCGHTVAWAR